MLTALAIGIGVFGVPMPSHVPGVLAVCLIGLSTFLAVGCALAALYPSATAATGIGNVLMILLMLTSGAFTPLAAMPSAIQQIVKYSPVRWFVEGSHTSLIGHPSSTTRRATFKRWRGVSAALACVIVPPVMAAEKRQGPEPVQGRAGECRARWDWTRSPRASVVNGGRAQFWVRWNPG